MNLSEFPWRVIIKPNTNFKFFFSKSKTVHMVSFDCLVRDGKTVLRKSIPCHSED